MANPLRARMLGFCFAAAATWVVLALLTGCEDEAKIEDDWPEGRTRAESIPADAVKRTPQTDAFPPVLHSTLWDEPVPLAGPVNTAGAEDAPTIAPDGETFLFFFTPDVDVPPNQQLLDEVTGIWWCRREGNSWTEPERVRLHDDLALDGPMWLAGETLWFASIRQGNFGSDGDLFTAQRGGSGWTNWQNAGALLNGTYNAGECALTGDGQTLYFDRASGGFGGYDIWRTTRAAGDWSEPENLGAVINSAENESRPWISTDGSELWFTADSRLGYTGPALFRSVAADSGWSAPEEVLSNFAGDASLDAAGNVYFTHHFFDSSLHMIEADIYVAYRR